MQVELDVHLVAGLDVLQRADGGDKLCFCAGQVLQGLGNGVFQVGGGDVFQRSSHGVSKSEGLALEVGVDLWA